MQARSGDAGDTTGTANDLAQQVSCGHRGNHEQRQRAEHLSDGPGKACGRAPLERRKFAHSPLKSKEGSLPSCGQSSGVASEAGKPVALSVFHEDRTVQPYCSSTSSKETRMTLCRVRRHSHTPGRLM